MSAPSASEHPAPLARHYTRFRVAERLLFTGHSHQAWPDRAWRGQEQAWLDAAALVDEKWEQAERRAERVKAGYRGLLDDPDGCYALGASTHELLVRLLSALPLAHRRRLVTTDGEFHSARRQLARLEEEGIEVVRVPAMPAASVGERLAAATDDGTAAVLTSTVFFLNAHIAGDLTPAAEAVRRHGAVLALDVYHQLNAVPWSIRGAGLEDAFVLGGGYKYCQLGEGNAFLRFPRGCELRPVVTGWFAEFAELEEGSSSGRVGYASGDDRFAGATYDPTSHYRAAEVFDFFQEQHLDPRTLRRISRRQVGLLAEAFDGLDLDPAVIRRDRSVPLDRVGGFLALETPRAAELDRRLRYAGVHSDYRGELLRLGPAPYLSDRQLRDAVTALGEAARALPEE